MEDIMRAIKKILVCASASVLLVALVMSVQTMMQLVFMHALR